MPVAKTQRQERPGAGVASHWMLQDSLAVTSRYASGLIPQRPAPRRCMKTTPDEVDWIDETDQRGGRAISIRRNWACSRPW